MKYQSDVDPSIFCDGPLSVSNFSRRGTFADGLIDWSRETKKGDKASADVDLDALELQETDPAKQDIEGRQAIPSTNASAAREQLEGPPRGVYGCPVTQINPFDPTNNTEFLVGTRLFFDPYDSFTPEERFKRLVVDLAGPRRFNYPYIIIATSSVSGDADMSVYLEGRRKDKYEDRTVPIREYIGGSKTYTEDRPSGDFFEDSVFIPTDITISGGQGLALDVILYPFGGELFGLDNTLATTNADVRVLIIWYDFECRIPFKIAVTNPNATGIDVTLLGGIDDSKNDGEYEEPRTEYEYDFGNLTDLFPELDPFGRLIEEGDGSEMKKQKGQGANDNGREVVEKNPLPKQNSSDGTHVHTKGEQEGPTVFFPACPILLLTKENNIVRSGKSQIVTVDLVFVRNSGFPEVLIATNSIEGPAAWILVTVDGQLAGNSTEPQDGDVEAFENFVRLPTAEGTFMDVFVVSGGDRADSSNVQLTILLVNGVCFPSIDIPGLFQQIPIANAIVEENQRETSMFNTSQDDVVNAATSIDGPIDWSHEVKKGEKASADMTLNTSEVQEKDSVKETIEKRQTIPLTKPSASREQSEAPPRGVYGCPVTQINAFDPTNNTEFITQIDARNCISFDQDLAFNLGYPAIVVATSSRSGDADIVADRAASKAYTEDPPDDDFYEDAVLESPLFNVNINDEDVDQTLRICFEAFRDAAFYNLRPTTANVRVLIIFYDYECHLPFNITSTPGFNPRPSGGILYFSYPTRLPPPGSGEPSTGIPLRSADYEFDFGEFEYLFDDQTD